MLEMRCFASAQNNSIWGMQYLYREMLNLMGVGLSLLITFANSLKRFFALQSRGIFVRWWPILASKEGPCWKSFSQILHEKGVEIGTQKVMSFGSFLGGAGGRAEACLGVQILQTW